MSCVAAYSRHMHQHVGIHACVLVRCGVVWGGIGWYGGVVRPSDR